MFFEPYDLSLHENETDIAVLFCKLRRHRVNNVSVEKE